MISRYELAAAVEMAERQFTFIKLDHLCNKVARMLGNRISATDVHMYLRIYSIRPRCGIVEIPASKNNSGIFRQICTTPSGTCPFKLVHTNELFVILWIKAILEYGKQQSIYYSGSAIMYWARQQLDISLDIKEREKLFKFINKCYKNLTAEHANN